MQLIAVWQSDVKFHFVASHMLALRVLEHEHDIEIVLCIIRVALVHHQVSESLADLCSDADLLHWNDVAAV